MKRSLIFIVILFSLIILGTGCYKDIISPGQDPNGPPQYVSFSGDLLPIFSKNCATSGCHSEGAHNPILTPSKAYTSLITGGYVNTVVPEKSAIYTAVKPGGAMPTLNSPELQLLLDWIRNGTPNN